MFQNAVVTDALFPPDAGAAGRDGKGQGEDCALTLMAAPNESRVAIDATKRRCMEMNTPGARLRRMDLAAPDDLAQLLTHGALRIRFVRIT